jgi:hypothetical protein
VLVDPNLYRPIPFNKLEKPSPDNKAIDTDVPVLSSGLGADPNGKITDH